MTVLERRAESPGSPGRPSLLKALDPFVVPRRRGQWVADGLAFALAVTGWYVYGFVADQPLAAPGWYRMVDLVLGAAACVSLWWARRAPVVVGLWLIVPGSIALTAGVAALAGVYRTASLARPRCSVPIALAHIACALPFHAFLPVVGMSWTAWFVTIPLVYLLMLSFGLLARSRRQVIDGIAREAERERQSYRAQLEDLRRSERERIAAEMHDVLAHRLSLLSVHAGALEYRTADLDDDDPGLRPAEVHRAATVIRDNAHQAIEELRGMLLVLREQDREAEPAVGPPQPRLVDVPTLVEEAVAAGQRVSLRAGPGFGADLRPSAQRTVYRVVQEGLTNARKHAPRAPVDVELSTVAGTDVVRVVVSNPVPPGLTSSEIPGAGTGLSGLTERVRVEGGRLRYRISEGRFAVTAEVPGNAGTPGASPGDGAPR